MVEGLGAELRKRVELVALTPIRVVCVYGLQDSTALCPHLSPSPVEIIAVPGGHHLDGAVSRVVGEILARLPQ